MALKGIKVIELAGLAPAPFCGMILADFGAKVTRIDRVSGSMFNPDTLARGKTSVAVDLKQPEGVAALRKLCSSADVLIEPFRKGVMEKLGLGPDRLLADNPRLIFARLTGFGQSGALSHKAGHDINFIAMSGVLSQIGRRHEKPYAPLNILGDFAGGGLTCALGIALALYERTVSGKGQVIDANMVQGSAYVSSFLWKTRGLFLWSGERGTNILDGGAPYYDTYKTKDGKFVSIGALEPQFYSDLLKGLGLTNEKLPQTTDPAIMAKVFKMMFLTKTRDEWTEVFKDLDACYAPVLEMQEVYSHPHNSETGTFIENSYGSMEPAPALGLSRTPGVGKVADQPEMGQHTVTELMAAGYSREEVQSLMDAGVVYQAPDSKSKL